MQELFTKIQNSLPYIIGGLLIVGLICFGLWWFLFKTKHLKMDNVYFISGGVKTGKSVLSMFLVVFKYWKNVISFYIRKILVLELNLLTFWKVNKFKVEYETMMKPMLYTNMPFRYIRFNRLTLDIINRRVRIPNKSCVLIDEASILADSMLYKDKNINTNLTWFYKLWGHYSHGGTMVINSQCISDNHYSLRRSMSRYLYIYSRSKFPFITLFKVCEQVYSDDKSSINVNSGDMEKQGLMTLVMPNFIYKFYDCYYLSVYTDDLAYYVDYEAKVLKKGDSLKATNIVSLQDLTNLDRRLNNEKE